MPAIVTPIDNKRAVIAFARRLGDHINVGAQEYNALPIVAEQLRATGSQADADVAAIAIDIQSYMKEGSTKEAWAPHAAILGEHLVSLVSSAYEIGDGQGRLASALIAAAETLESDIRTGYAS